MAPKLDELSTRPLTVTEGAALLGVAPATLYRWAERGTVPSLKVGRLRRFRETDLKRWLETQAEGNR